MTKADVIALALLAVTALIGLRRGLVAQLLGLAGLIAGALVGARLLPGFLDEQALAVWRPYAPLAGAALGAFGGQLVAGVAAGTLRSVFVRGPLRLVDSLGGLALGMAVGVGLAWIGAVVALHEPRLGLRDDVRRSDVLLTLTRTLPTEALLETLARFDPLPLLARLPGGELPRPDRSVLGSSATRTAAASVVKVVGKACGLGLQGSGWVVSSELVATNAHVIAGERQTQVLVPDGERLEAIPVYVDHRDDVALLRVEGLDAPVLPAVTGLGEPRPVVILGYPHNGALTASAATAGPPERILIDVDGRRHSRRVIPLRGRVEPGDSGGPAVDRRGRVVAMTFAAASESSGGFGVPVRTVLRAARAPLEPVSTGACQE